MARAAFEVTAVAHAHSALASWAVWSGAHHANVARLHGRARADRLSDCRARARARMAMAGRRVNDAAI
jgi:hypothetical protein